jgi:hypothetical protein
VSPLVRYLFPLAVWALAVFMAFLVCRGIRSGRAHLGGSDRIDRRQQPLVFWGLIALQAGVGLVLAFFAVVMSHVIVLLLPA